MIARYSIGAFAAAALATGLSGASLVARREEPAPPTEPRFRSYRAKGHGGRPRSHGKYKGSPTAKRATRRGGNPAAHQ